MKTIGMIGGLSWVSSLEYYKIINQKISSILGAHSAKIIMNSLDIHEIVTPSINENWENILKIIILAAQKVEKSGADFIIICCNTMHNIANEVENNIDIPLLHITDCVGYEINQQGYNKVGLIGSKDTMEGEIFRDRLFQKYGVKVIIPDEEERNISEDIIFNELIFNKFKNSSKQKYLKMIMNIKRKGAQGIILGCTEMGQLVNEKDINIPLFDSTRIHALQAVKYSLRQ